MTVSAFSPATNRPSDCRKRHKQAASTPVDLRIASERPVTVIKKQARVSHGKSRTNFSLKKLSYFVRLGLFFFFVFFVLVFWHLDSPKTHTSASQVVLEFLSAFTSAEVTVKRQN